MLGEQELTKGAWGSLVLPLGRGEEVNRTLVFVTSSVSRGAPVMGQGRLLWEDCPRTGVGLCTAAREGRLGNLLASLWREKGPQFLMGEYCSCLLSPTLTTRGQRPKGNRGCCSSSWAVLQPCRGPW